MRTKSGTAAVISIRCPGAAVLSGAGNLAARLPDHRRPVNPRAARLPCGAAARVMRGPGASRDRAFSFLANCGSRPATLRIFRGRGA